MIEAAGLVVAVTVALFASGLIKGCTGFGAGLLSVALVAQAFPEKSTLVAHTLSLWLNNVVLLFREAVTQVELRHHWMFPGAATAGSVLGAVGFAFLPINGIQVAIDLYLLVSLLTIPRFRGNLLTHDGRRGLRRPRRYRHCAILIGGRCS